MSEAAINRADVLRALSGHVGVALGVHIGQLTHEITGLAPDPAHERRVRVLIEELRREGEHICATPRDGYFIAQTAEELEATCKFLYDRAMTTLKQVSAMKKIALPDLAGQLHIKT